MSLSVADCLIPQHVIYYIYQTNGLTLYPKEVTMNNNLKPIDQLLDN